MEGAVLMTEPVDVRRLQYMPLYLERLQRSKAWLRCKRRPEMAFYLMNLWMRAYREVPAGSIENDDDILADAAMCDPEEWDRVRADVLRGWDEREGRLYHPVVEEVAAEAAAKLRGNRKRTEEARATREQMRLDLTNPLPLDPSDPSDLCHSSVTEHEAEAEAEAEAEKEVVEENAQPQRSTTSDRGSAAATPLEMMLREAAGLVGDKASALRKTGQIERLMAEGVSLEHVILPAVRGVASEGRRGRSWAYYLDAIRERAAGAVLPAGAAPQLAVAKVWVARDSPNGRAWTKHELAAGRVDILWIQGKTGVGRALDSAWPPGHEPERSAA